MKLNNSNLLRQQAYINGQFVDALDRQTFAVHNPFNGEKIADVADCSVKDTQVAIEKLLLGGKRYGTSNSLIYEPTVLTEVNKDMQVFQQEIFGPVAPVLKFETEEEVLILANDTPYGLTAYFYGRDYARIWRVAEGLDYGMVGINTGMISTTVAPFGGVKESGFGREGSKYGMDDYLEMKYLCWGL